MYELSLIKSLLNKDNYIGYRSYLRKEDFSKELYGIITGIDEWYKLHAEEPKLEDIANITFAAGIPEKQLEYVKGIFNSLQTIDGQQSVKLLLDKYRNQRLLEDLATASYNASRGGSMQDTLRIADQLRDPKTVTDIEYVTDDLQEILDESVRKPGLRWRLGSLNRSLGSLRKGDFGFIFARPECFAKGTLVLKSNGIPIPIENLRAGMSVLGPDSKPRRVLATSKGQEKMYRVSYPWGDSFVCNESHILQLRAEGETTTQVKVKDYLNWSAKLKHRFKQYKVGVEFPYQPVKLDPYVLGLWLGDGTSASPQFTNADPEVIDYLQAWAEDSGLICNVYERASQGKANTISISSKTKKHGANTFTQFLKSRRLLRNKHIPINYLTNSRDVRLNLLAGLLDTDGWKEKNSFGFCNKNSLLCDQVVWLARSLGLHATKRLKVVKGVDYYVVGIYGECYNIPVKIIRKQVNKPTAKPKRKGLNFGFTITEEPNVNEYYGIQVDQDSLYLLNDFTVVHNTGKTTFLASEVTHMASQLTEESGPILWFNNEEAGKKVKLRCFQAALGARIDHLLRAPDRAKVGYQEKLNGKLKLFDSDVIHRLEVEQIVQKEQPSLIVFDQIDKVKGFNNDREDLIMGAIYQWARELAKKYCPVIGICQADGSAEGEKWLHMAHVSNAKTAKQAEADFILGIGRTNDPGAEYLRYINISKNKLIGDSDTEAGLRHGRLEVLIHPDVARYSDLGERIDAQ